VTCLGMKQDWTDIGLRNVGVHCSVFVYTIVLLVLTRSLRYTLSIEFVIAQAHGNNHILAYQ
jgi:hypothetical protein